MEFSLKNKNALIVGASEGIGKAIALKFAKYGANTLTVARSEQVLKESSQFYGDSFGGEHKFVAHDINDIEGAIDKIKTQWGEKPFHILVNNCAGPKGGPLLEADFEAFSGALDAHLKSAHALTRFCHEGMKKEGYGRIINILSTSVKSVLPNLGVSNTLRGAMANWGKTLSKELGPDHITVNNILPGPTETKRLQSLLEKGAKLRDHSLEDEKKRWLKDIPLGRFADPEETACAALFLASPAASFITGVSLAVDGGRLSTD